LVLDASIRREPPAADDAPVDATGRTWRAPRRRCASFATSLTCAPRRSGSQTVRPLPAHDDWLAKPDRWRWLLAAWLCRDRHLGVAGATGLDGKLIPAVAVHDQEPGAELRRADVLAALAGVAGSIELDKLTDRLRWQRPALRRDGPAPATVPVRRVLHEAALLGVVADGALAGPQKAGDLDAATATLAAYAPLPRTWCGRPT
jgi:hypothetical protein